MSFIYDRVQLINGHLDQIQTRSLDHAIKPTVSSSFSTILDQRVLRLRALVTQASLRPTISSRPSKACKALAQVLRNAQSPLSDEHARETQATLTDSAQLDSDPTLHELHWQLVSRITTQTYGIFLDYLLQQAVTLESELAYWSEIRSSRRYTALYSIQTSPIRLYDWSKSIVNEVRHRRNVVAEGWQDLYDLVRNVIRERSMSTLNKRVMSPLALVTSQVNTKRANLQRTKNINANAIGYLMSNCFHEEGLSLATSDNSSKSEDSWKAITLHAISSIDAVLDALNEASSASEDFEDTVSETVRQDTLAASYRPFMHSRDTSRSLMISVDPSSAAERLDHILNARLSGYFKSSLHSFESNKRPSALIRYWLPASILLLSSSTLLRILANRRAELTQWVRELGRTTVDFWYNWVVDPTRKIIATIRHDESSEVSLMSKKSLEGDRASLERMVVDFAVDNPNGSALTQSDIAQVQADIRQGDLTPVLLSYEKELQKPIYSSIRGNLIRALLIQIQKTKVDVEIAMGGIDALLKSQELVFGFVGLTPGILVCFGMYRWLSSLSDNRSGFTKAKKQSQAYRILRNIDRLLTASPQSDTGSLSSQEFGLLVCEAVVLRDLASKTFPRQTYQEFTLDLNDLLDRNSGVGRQIRVADRVRWAYARWLS